MTPRYIRGQLNQNYGLLLIRDTDHGIAIAIGCDGRQLSVSMKLLELDAAHSPRTWSATIEAEFSCN